MKRYGFWVLRFLLLAALLLFFYYFATNKPLEKLVEEPYWQVSQFETSFWRLKSDLARHNDDGQASQERVQNSLAVFLSKLRLLTRDSPSREDLLKNKDFAAYLPELARLDADLGALHAGTGSLRAPQAARLLERLDAEDRMVSDLSASMWQMQLDASDVAFEAAEERDKKIDRLILSLAVMIALALIIYTYYNWDLYRKNRELARSRDELSDRNQELAQQKQLLEETVAEKNQFMGMVSHELKSPLQTISSSAESLMNPVDPHKRKQLLDRIQRATLTMKLQINDLLTLARSEAGALEFRPDEFCVQELLQEVLDLEAQNAYQKGLRLSIHAPEEPLFAIADSGRLMQILGNLTSNAIKYTDKGAVALALADHADNKLVFTVSDSGPGMPSGFTPLEIQPFKRFGDLHGGDGAGAGIGLKIAYSLAEYLSGELHYDSDEGGTRFTLTVPAFLLSGEQQTTLPPGRLHWLLVDDNRELLASLQSECHALGIDADVAPSPAIAANMMAANSYDLALIDVNMPGRRGDELARDFRRGRAMANPHCLLYGMSAVEQTSPQPRSPFDKMLDKPIRIKVLLASLTRPASDSPSASQP
jgi:signal transduction histidine kinase/CheY-like chemotaxis protein